MPEGIYKQMNHEHKKAIWNKKAVHEDKKAIWNY